MPDIPIQSLGSNALIDALQRNELIFDFATDFHYGHPFENLDEFTFTSKDYQAFKEYVKENNFSFQTPTETLLEGSINGDDSLLGPEVQEKYKELLLAVNRGKITALDTYQREIQKILEDEIITRYFYREGLYRYYLTHDDAIGTARALLADGDKYRSILN